MWLFGTIIQKTVIRLEKTKRTTFFYLLIDGCWKTIGSLYLLWYLLNSDPRHSLEIIHCSNTSYNGSHFPINFSHVSSKLNGSVCHVMKTLVALNCKTYSSDQEDNKWYAFAHSKISFVDKIEFYFLSTDFVCFVRI